MFSALLKIFLVATTLTLSTIVAVNGQGVPPDPIAKSLPDKIGDYRATGAPAKLTVFTGNAPANFPSVTRTYALRNSRFIAHVSIAASDSATYSQFTQNRSQLKGLGRTLTTAYVGTDGFYYSDEAASTLTFFKGNSFVSIRDESKSRSTEELLEFGRTFANTLDKGEGEIPALVKHLPDWPNVSDRTLYLISKEDLKQTLPSQSVLDVLNFEGGAETAVADYNGARLALIEFYTPQLATDNDARILAKLQELRSQNQPSPSAYRRVGNYSIFVFDAPDAQAANNLIDQVKYQQVVQWLGRNPNIYDRAANEFTRTTLGVFIAVVKASGLALLITFAVGFVVGAFLFSKRRKQKSELEAYSDAGGMLRLNLDEMTPSTDPARLLGPGK